MRTTDEKLNVLRPFSENVEKIWPFDKLRLPVMTVTTDTKGNKVSNSLLFGKVNYCMSTVTFWWACNVQTVRNYMQHASHNPHHDGDKRGR
jgi:hypothetical protein